MKKLGFREAENFSGHPAPKCHAPEPLLHLPADPTTGPHSLPDRSPPPTLPEKKGFPPQAQRGSELAQGHPGTPAPAYSHRATLLEYCCKFPTHINSPTPLTWVLGFIPLHRGPTGLSHKPGAAPSSVDLPRHLHRLPPPPLLPGPLPLLLLLLGDVLGPASLPCQAGTPACQQSCGWHSCRRRCSPGR